MEPIDNNSHSDEDMVDARDRIGNRMEDWDHMELEAEAAADPNEFERNAMGDDQGDGIDIVNDEQGVEVRQQNQLLEGARGRIRRANGEVTLERHRQRRPRQPLRRRRGEGVEETANNNNNIHMNVNVNININEAWGFASNFAQELEENDELLRGGLPQQQPVLEDFPQLPPLLDAEVRFVGPAAAAAAIPIGNLGRLHPDNNINYNNNNMEVIGDIRINEDGNIREEEDDNDFDDFMMMDFAQGRFEHRINALRASRESISSGLFEMVQESRTCISVLSGWGRSGQTSCNSIVQHCRSNPDDALYVSRLGRMPLHEACLRGACRHVIKVLLEATNNRGAKERDFQGNTPLHLLFVDYSSSDLNNANLVWSPEDLAQVVGDLLAVNPLTIASSTNVDGDTPLHSACMAPETMVDPSSIVQLLRASPRAATKINRKSQTPLRLHCQRRNASPEVASLLLEENSHALIVLDVERGWAPIHAAASNANFKLLRYLVESFPESVKVQTTQRQTALHLLCKQHTHLSSSSSVPSRNNHNSSAFGSSSSSSIPNVEAAVEFLLEADPQAIMHKDSTNGYTPLHLVCKTEGSRQVPLPVVKLLLGCNPMAAGIPDHQQYLPLHHSCEMGSNPEVIQALVKAYPDSTKALTRKKDSALSLACTSNKSTDTVKLLIEANKDVLTQKNDYGYCPLHCVCRTHQPRMGIVKALVEACPESVNLQTHSGETPFHLASSNTGAFVGVLQLLAQTQAKLRGIGESLSESLSEATKEHAAQLAEAATLIETNTDAAAYNNNSENESHRPLHQQHSIIRDPSRHDAGESANNNNRNSRSFLRRTVTTNKMGNTPLHDACFRSTPYEHLEVIAKANPEYILVRNNAGYTPLQILCKNGRIDERIISTFAQMGGPEIFSVKDSNGNTPLHSAMRKDVDVASLRCLIRASPDALRCRTTYGDLPLHLACLRKCSSEVVQEVAIAASSGDASLAVVPNLAGQTPIGITMGEFKHLCQEGNTCTVSAAYRPNQRRIFQVLSTLVKIVHYGPVKCQQQGTKDLSLLKACVVLHRQNIRLDPAFIRQVIHVYPEEVKLVDEDGNYPLHIEASIPIEKMALLDGTCTGPSHRRMGILRILLEAYPSACSFRNKENHFPLGLMIQAGRVWGHTIAVALRAFPPALHWYKGLDDRFSSILLEKASKECGADTLFQLLQSRPGLFDATSHRREALPGNRL